MASLYTFDPQSKQLLYSNPNGVTIPESAFQRDTNVVYIQPSKRTSPFLVAIAVTLFVLLILVSIFLIWLLFVKTSDQRATDIFFWLVGK